MDTQMIRPCEVSSESPKEVKAALQQAIEFRNVRIPHVVMNGRFGLRRAVVEASELKERITVVVLRKNKKPQRKPDGSLEYAKIRRVELSGSVRLLWKD